MTCIILAKKSKFKCVSASDRRLSLSRDEYTTDTNPKVKKIEGVIVGGAGDAGPIDMFFLMDHIIKELPQALDPFRFIVTVIVPNWRSLLVDSHVLNPESNQDGPESDVFLAHKGRCFSISLESNGSITAIENTLPTSFGCGGSLALAAFKALQSRPMKGIFVSSDLREAVKIASTINLACDDFIDIVSE